MQQAPELRHIPLAVAEVVDRAPHGLGRVDIERPIRCTVRRLDRQVSEQRDERLHCAW
jgi:hypothetical protein